MYGSWTEIAWLLRKYLDLSASAPFGMILKIGLI